MVKQSGKTGASLNRHGSAQDIGTPPEFIDAVERRFGKIVLDLAANATNAICPDYYGPGGIEENSLDARWYLGRKTKPGVNWLNCPFGNVAQWAEKCAVHRDCPQWTLLLVPASVGSQWFSKHCLGQAHVMALRQRITFVGQTQPYPRDLMLCAYGFSVFGFESWSWAK